MSGVGRRQKRVLVGEEWKLWAGDKRFPGEITVGGGCV